MRLLSLGVDHLSAPTAVREALAVEGTRRDGELSALRRRFPSCEFVLLSTCNRVEAYVATEDDPAAPEVETLADWLAEYHGISASQLAPHLVAHHDEAMVAHLFRVASSLESLVLGEGQILGQVRDAYRAAVAGGTVGPILHEIFQQAIRVGKRVREETGLDRGKLSVASVAVDLSREVFDTFSDKTVLVIGAGKMGELTLEHLTELRPGRILITNRTPDLAEAAASRFRGETVPVERLGQALIDADLVVSTTAAEEPIVTLETYTRIQRARRHRLSLILDIAIPRDFDPAIGELDQVLLYNVDDLKAQVARNLEGRRKGIDPAQAIIASETAACRAAVQYRQHAGAILRQLGEYADHVRLRELEKLYASTSDLTPEQKAAVAHFAQRLQNQFLHHPRSALRDVGTTTEPDRHHSLFATVRHLFGLADR